MYRFAAGFRLGATGGGGGILNSGTLTVSNSTLSGNSARLFGLCGIPNLRAGGGGIHNGGDMFIVNSTISNNQVDFRGINNCTECGGGSIYNGGGAGGGISYIDNSTISENEILNGLLSSYGGGIFNRGTANLQVSNSILSSNVVTDGGYCWGNNDVIYSLVADGSCGVASSTDGNLTGDPLLGPLADNGGPTLTHALLAGSPAINAGNDDDANFALCFDTDQRGVARPQGAGCDMGAYEVEVTAVTPTATITPTEIARTNEVPTCTYNLYHSLFPTSGFSILVADMSITPYDMSGDLGGAPDYYYVGVDCGAGGTAVSNTVGEFSFTIVPGS